MRFIGWTVVGASAVFGVLAMLTIGLPVVLLAGVVAVVLVLRGMGGEAGMLTGAGLPILYVAWLNRAGPGYVCTVEATSTHCRDSWNPWPFLVVGVALVLAGAALRGRASRSAAASSSA